MSADIERQQAALEIIRHIVTQTITLCTTLVAAGVGLAKVGQPLAENSWQFGVIVGCFIGSVLLGVLALGAITSKLINSSLDVGKSGAVQGLAGAQLVVFAVGLVMSGVLAFSLAT